jgi:hypothetical protein
MAKKCKRGFKFTVAELEHLLDVINKIAPIGNPAAALPLQPPSCCRCRRRAAAAAAVLLSLPTLHCHHHRRRATTKLPPLLPSPSFSLVIVAVIIAISFAIAAIAFNWLLVCAPTIAVATSVFVATVAARSGSLAVVAAAAITAAPRPADEWTKMGALLGFWSVDVLWANPPLLLPEIELRINYVFAIHKHKISFGTRNLCITNAYHLYVFVIHKHKINFGNAPVSLWTL